MLEANRSLLFDERNDIMELEEENDEKNTGADSSPFQRLKSKTRKKMDDIAYDITQDFKDELQDQKKNIKKAENVANDLVEPGTLHRLKEIILEKPDIEEGFDWKLWYHIIVKSFTYVILKFADIITDFAAAHQHFKRSDYKYGGLTLLFVYLPGFVISVGFTYWGLTALRTGKSDEPTRKKLTCKRLARYVGLLFLFPLLYPIIQVALGLLLVILLIRRRDREPLKFMGHDLKQFKSLEGFLESGPQFVLQSYILMVGQKRNTNIDFNDIRKEDATRLAILSLSVLVSFISLVKTAVQVNVPDPDERRRDKQHKENVPHFKLSLIFFTFFCVLFRLLSLAFFCVYLKLWTMILIVSAFISNVIVLCCVGTTTTIVIILGAISIFVPNGYLLYNFAGTLPVDFDRKQSRILFLCFTLIVNLIWMSGIGGIFYLAEYHELPGEFVIQDKSTQYKVIIGMNISLLGVGVTSSVLAIIHWFFCIRKLFMDPEIEENEEMAES